MKNKNRILFFLVGLIPQKTFRNYLMWRLQRGKKETFGDIVVVRNLFNIDVLRGGDCLRVSTEHIDYVYDIVGNFDFYFDSVISKNRGSKKLVDFSKKQVHRIKGFDLFDVMLPSFSEPIKTTWQYLNFANIDHSCVVLDLGAYSALTSIMFDMAISKENKNAKGKVIAVDADYKNVDCINYNLAKYESISQRRIEFLHAAVWNQDGEISFSSEGNMGASAVEFIGKRGKVVKIKSITLSSIAENFGLQKVDFIKCDIEGGETAIFKDAKFFEKYRPRIIIEAHKTSSGTSVDVVMQDLSKFNYKFALIKQEGCAMPLIECTPN